MQLLTTGGTLLLAVLALLFSNKGAHAMDAKPPVDADSIAPNQFSAPRTSTAQDSASQQQDEASEEQVTYWFPQGVGSVIFSGCSARNYDKSSACYNSKVFQLLAAACPQLLPAAAYIGVGIDGRGYYSTESRRESLLQYSCSKKAKFQGRSVPDILEVSGIYETKSKIYTFDSLNEYLLHLHLKAGISTPNLFFRELSRFNPALLLQLGAVPLLNAAAILDVSRPAAGVNIDILPIPGASRNDRPKRPVRHMLAVMYINVNLYDVAALRIGAQDIKLSVLEDFLGLPNSHTGAGAAKKYQDFIQTYGSHCIKSGKFGGQLKIIKTPRTDTTMSAEEFARIAHAEFELLLGQLQLKAAPVTQLYATLKLPGRSKNWNPSGDFLESKFTKTVVETRGGSTKAAEILLDLYAPTFKKSVSDWLVSVKTQPKIFDFQLIGVDALFDLSVDDLFPQGVVNFGCVGGKKGTKIKTDPKTKRRYFLNVVVDVVGGKEVKREVRSYCRYKNKQQFMTAWRRRLLALKAALSLYMAAGAVVNSKIRLPAGQPGCEEATFAGLRASVNAGRPPKFSELLKGFLLSFDLPLVLPGIATRQAKYRMLFRSGSWYATNPRSSIMHLYDGCPAPRGALKICVKGLILTYIEAQGLFRISRSDLLKLRVRLQLPAALSASIVAKAVRLGPQLQVSAGVHVSLAALPCHLRWSSSQRINPRKPACIHMTAATDGDLFVVFAGSPRDHRTWLYLQITSKGVFFYSGLTLRAGDLEASAGLFISPQQYHALTVCLVQRGGQATLQVATREANSRGLVVLAGLSLPIIGDLNFYAFGGGLRPVVVIDIRVTLKLPNFKCPARRYIKRRRMCILRCHGQCIGCFRARDNAACQRCRNFRVIRGRGASRIIRCVGVCPAGTQPSANRQCIPCRKGSFKNKAGSGRCKSCPAGRIAATGGLTKCEECPAGRIAATGGLAKCDKCPAGTIAATGGLAKCDKCPAGTIADVEGLAQCKSCPLGQSTPDRTACVLPGLRNLKLGKCSQSGTKKGANADDNKCENAFDGKKPFVFRADQCSSTRNRQSPKWQAELQQRAFIMQVKVYLAAGVSINNIAVTINSQACEPLVSSRPYVYHCNRFGTTVRITGGNTAIGNLEICEVEATGFALGSGGLIPGGSGTLLPNGGA